MIDNLFLQKYIDKPYLVQKKAKYLILFCLIVVAICLIGLLIGSGGSESLFYGVSLISFVATIVLARKGQFSAAVWVVTILMSVDIICDILQFNPVSYERIVETVMESFLSYLFIGFVSVNRRQILYTIFSNTIITALHVALIIHFGYAHSTLPSVAYRYFVGGIASVLLVGLFTLKVVRVHEEALRILEQQKNSLTMNNQQLEELVSLHTKELETANRKLESLNNELMALSMEDQLTGIPNRRKILQDAEMILAKDVSDQSTLCVAMLDIDHFKRVNDTYGHLAGDEALKAFAEVVRSTLRSTDILGRIGGEEFLIVMETASRQDSIDVLEKVKRTVEESSISLLDKNTVNLTVSIGAAELTGNQSLRELIQEADIALYYAKSHGRNRVTLFSDLGKSIGL